MPLLLPDNNNTIPNAHLLLRLCLGTQGLQGTPCAYLASGKHRRDSQLSAADSGCLPRGKGVKENSLRFLLDRKDVFPIPTLTPESRPHLFHSRKRGYLVLIHISPPDHSHQLLQNNVAKVTPHHNPS